MTDLKKIREKFYLILFIFVFVVVSNQTVLAKTDLKINGSVVAYSLPREEWFNFTFLGITNILVVKVLKVVKGKEKSEFIIVRYTGNRKDYPVSEFTINKVFRFNLEKYDWDGVRIKEYMFVRALDENDNIIFYRSDLKFVEGFGEQLIPKDLLMPTYFISR
jgi:hypothetical protein